MAGPAPDPREIVDVLVEEGYGDLSAVRSLGLADLLLVNARRAERARRAAEARP